MRGFSHSPPLKSQARSQRPSCWVGEQLPRFSPLVVEAARTILKPLEDRSSLSAFSACPPSTWKPQQMLLSWSV